MAIVKVEGGQFVKNTENRALLTVNRTALSENEARKKLSQKLSAKNDEINTLKTQVESLSNDVGDIKRMLSELLTKS